MMWNSFVTSFRFILKSKVFTTINLIGLTAGLTASFFLFIYIINELSYNTGFQENNRIFRVITETSSEKSPLSPFKLSSALQAQNETVKKSGCLVFLPFQVGAVSVKQHDKLAKELTFICADQEILDILSIHVIKSSNTSNLSDSNTVIISESASRRCFGDEDPVGKKLEVNVGGVPALLTVTGLFQDLPWNSTMKIDYIASMDVFYTVMTIFGVDLDEEIRSGEDSYVETYILTQRSVQISAIQDQMSAIIDTVGLSNEEISFTFQNITDIYLGSADTINDFHLKGDRNSLFYYSSLAIFILLLAGINYSILSTARSALRFKEIGVRKVLGATKRALRMQILIESMLLTFLAFPLSFLVLGIVEPFMSDLYGYEIRLYTFNMLIYIPLFAGITLLIGFISGAYLAIYLSALHPLKAIKNQIFTRQRFSISKIFIIFQLFITLSLLICVVIIFAQLNYCLHGKTGIKKENLLLVSFDPGDFPHYQALRKAAEKEEGVIAISGTFPIPLDDVAITNSVKLEDSAQSTIYYDQYFVDKNFLETLGVDLIAGTGFVGTDSLFPGITTILNQEAVKELMLLDPINSSIGSLTFIGVAEDCNLNSFHTRIKPAMFIYNPTACRTLVVRCLPGSLEKITDAIRNQWEELAPDLPFNYSTYTDKLSNIYSQEQKFGQVVSSFSLLAFIITGMGLFGLALLISERRMKETAIRKVFGASNADILFRMQKEFLVYIAIASLIAVPATWILMSYWLSSFYYKTGMHWYLFVISIISVTIFVSAIILMRTYRVLHQNPINALRYE